MSPKGTWELHVTCWGTMKRTRNQTTRELSEQLGTLNKPMSRGIMAIAAKDFSAGEDEDSPDFSISPFSDAGL